MTRSEEIIEELRKIITPRCELDFNNNFELICAVMLSAQTTDKAVNKYTPELFSKYPDALAMSKANPCDVEEIIKPLGLSKNKSNYLVNLSKVLVEKYNSVIPNTLEELMELPGVGRKTASVVLALGFGIPAFPVDTHVYRVARRLKMAKMDDDILTVEEKLRRQIPKRKWTDSHHLLLLFGRYYCKSKKSLCEQCSLKKFCRGI